MIKKGDLVIKSSGYSDVGEAGIVINFRQGADGVQLVRVLSNNTIKCWLIDYVELVGHAGR